MNSEMKRKPLEETTGALAEQCFKIFTKPRNMKERTKSRLTEPKENTNSEEDVTVHYQL